MYDKAFPRLYAISGTCVEFIAVLTIINSIYRNDLSFPDVRVLKKLPYFMILSISIQR